MAQRHRTWRGPGLACWRAWPVAPRGGSSGATVAQQVRRSGPSLT